MVAGSNKIMNFLQYVYDVTVANGWLRRKEGYMNQTFGLQILVRNCAWSLKASHSTETNKTSSGLFIPKLKPQNSVIWRLNSIQICCASNMESDTI